MATGPCNDYHERMLQLLQSSDVGKTVEKLVPTYSLPSTYAPKPGCHTIITTPWWNQPSPNIDWLHVGTKYILEYADPIQYIVKEATWKSRWLGEWIPERRHKITGEYMYGWVTITSNKNEKNESLKK